MNILNDLHAAIANALAVMAKNQGADTEMGQAVVWLRSANNNLKYGIEELQPTLEVLTWLEALRVKEIQVGNLDMAKVEVAGNGLMNLGAICPLCWINHDRAELVTEQVCHQCGFNVTGE